MTSMPDHIRKAIPPLGQNAAPENSAAVRALYTPMLKGLMDGVSQKLDIAYGAHPRQQLDVYWIDDKPARGKPIFVYIPGGGFVGGDKRSDGVFYGNVGGWAARNGFVAMVANYRLAPEFKWPLASKDVESAVLWMRDHAAEFGGDGERIVIMGHSAGAAHVATFLFDPDIRGERLVKGGLLSSGPYSVPPGTKAPNMIAYYGDDEKEFARRSALNHVAGTRVPVCISVAEYDPPNLITPGFDMAKALVARSNTSPPIRCADGHNHFSTVSSMGSADNDFAAYTLEFARACVGD